MREEARAVWLSARLDDGIRDFGHAWRGLRRSPAFTAVVVLTLALCIGATTAVYSIVRHVLLAPLPYPDGNRIVSLETTHADHDGLRPFAMNAALFQLYVARSRTLEDFAAARVQMSPVGGGDSPDSAWVGQVTPSLLPMMRVRPALGRSLSSDDTRPGAPAVAMLSDGIWRSRFGGDSGVIGRVITVDGQPHTIVGVVPRDVGVPRQYGNPLEIWLPFEVDREPAAWIDYALARLRPGVTSAEASRELEAIRQTLPDTGWLEGRRAEALTAAEQVPPEERQALVVLFAAAGGLLLIACADIAALLLMRAWARRRELAIRLALGASRKRLARQSLTESLLLAAPGGALGLLVAWLGLRVAIALRPNGLELLDKASLDTTTLLWTAGVSVGTAMLVGIGPVMVARERSLDVALLADRAGAGRSRTGERAHAALVVGQIAVSLMFIATAGVVTQSFVGLALTPVGYEPDGLYEVNVQLTGAEPTAAARTLLATLAVTPGVSEVAVGVLPLSNAGPGPTAVDGPTGERPSTVALTGLTYVSAEYFHVARIPIVRGRGFNADPTVAAGDVVINEALARRLWPDRDAVGARLRDFFGEWLTVVGIVGDVQMPGSGSEFYRWQMYRPGLMPGTVVTLVLRARGDPARLRPLLTSAVERAGVGGTLRDVVAAESTLEVAFARPRFAVLIFVAFALVAVALASVGLFGIVAHAVARRKHEIGVRVALGAGPGVVGRLILGNGLRLAAVGCGLGILGAYAATRTLTTLLYAVSPPAPTILAGAVLLLLIIALIASFIPTRRALRIEPMDALRTD